MVGGIRFEHTHRVIAATVGLLTLILTCWLLFKESRRSVRWLGIGALGLVVFQGILGGMTVLWGLPPEVSIGHATLGQTFFATIVVLTTLLSPTWSSFKPVIAPPRVIASPSEGGTKQSPSDATEIPTLPRNDKIFPVVTAVAIYLQLILGAALRHLGWLPHLLATHILMALVVFILISRTAGTLLKNYRSIPVFFRAAQLLIWLLLAQFVLGFATLIQGADVLPATAHVAVGALLLAVSVRLSVYAFRRGPA
jgi:heme a synthase